jgi:D-alanine transaminase
VSVIELDGQQLGDGKPGPVFKKMDQLLQAYKLALS